MPQDRAVAVIGAGAIGCLVAAALAEQGRPVILVCRHDEQAAQINRVGLKVNKPTGHSDSVALTACTVLPEPIELAFLAFKAPALPEVVSSGGLRHVGTVVSLLNGLDHLRMLRAAGIQSRAAAIYVEAFRDSAHEVTHVSGSRIVLSRVQSGDSTDRVNDMLTSAGFHVDIDTEKRVLWAKLAVVTCAATIAAVAGQPIGVARTLHRDDVIALAFEVAAVSSADGVAIEAVDLAAKIAALPSHLRTSMERDISAGRPSELDAILGAVVRRGETLGLDVRRSRAMYDHLKHVELSRSGGGDTAG